MAGGKTPYAWSAQDLPAGISIDQATGTLKGTPTAAATANVGISLTDANGSKVTKNLPLKVQ